MAIAVACGSTVNATLAANTWTEIQISGGRPLEVHVGHSLTDLQYAYGLGDGGVLANGLPLSVSTTTATAGAFALAPPAPYGGKIALRSTAGGAVTVGIAAASL